MFGVSKEDVRVVADAIAREIIMWCSHSSGDPVHECLVTHMENPDVWDMYVPDEYRDLYRKIVESRKATAALDRLVRAKLSKALAKYKRLWK